MDISICREPEKLWNSTFVQLENELYQLVFDPDGHLAELEVGNENVRKMTCFKGEPDLEKLMAYGKECHGSSTDVQFTFDFL